MATKAIGTVRRRHHGMPSQLRFRIAFILDRTATCGFNNRTPQQFGPLGAIPQHAQDGRNLLAAVRASAALPHLLGRVPRSTTLLHMAPSFYVPKNSRDFCCGADFAGLPQRCCARRGVVPRLLSPSWLLTSHSLSGAAPTWSQWLVDDQREASGRPDVLAFTSDVLTSPLKICGEPVANLVASTSGTDSDWVVKLIDVYPDEVAAQPAMGGYQLMVSADIFRGRYRESPETPKAVPANEPVLYRINLPTANHVFLLGHRVMVQIQSSWFPLYDRNPQTFIPNIFWAKPADFQKAVAADLPLGDSTRASSSCLCA